MISHFVGNPHGPSLSFSFFSCGPPLAAAGAAVALPVVVAPFPVVVVLFCSFVVVVVVFASVAVTGFFSPSSHGCALATVS